MSNLATLLVTLGIDSKPFASGLDSAVQSANSAGHSIVSGLGSILKVGMVGVAAGTAGAIAGIFSGVASNAQFETFNTQFGVLLGSADKAQQRLDELSKFGATTPFELPELVKADKILVGFGLDSEDTAKKWGMSGAQIRTIVGDTASGTGASFEEMSLLLGKFSAGATGEAIARMAELGIASKTDLEAMGLEFSKSGQLLSPLPQSMDVVLKLMQNKYGGMMDAQSATFEGMLSNLSDWKDQTLRKISAPIFDVLKTNLGNLLIFLNSDAVMGTLNMLADIIANGLSNAINFVSTAIAAFNTGAVNGFASGLTNMLAALLPVNDTTSTFLDMLNNGITIISGVVSAIQTLVASGGNLNAVAANIQSVFGVDITPFITALDNIIAKFNPFIDTLQTRFNILKDFFTTTLDFISNTFNAKGASILDNTLTTFNAVFDTVSGVLTGINNVVNTILGEIFKFWKANGQDITNTVADVWQQVMTIIRLAMQVINVTIVPALQGIATFISNHSDTIQAVFSAVWTLIKTIITTALDTITTVLKVALALWNGDWTGAWNLIQDFSARFVTNLLTAFRALIDGLGNIIHLALDGVQDIFNGFTGQANNIGTNIINGILDGLRGAADRLFSYLRQLASDALANAMDVLDISSPSGAFAYVGEMSALGMQMGWDDNQPEFNVGNTLRDASNTGIKSSGVTNIWNIDARGSNWSEQQFKDKVLSVVNGVVSNANNSDRFSGYTA